MLLKFGYSKISSKLIKKVRENFNNFFWDYQIDFANTQDIGDESASEFFIKEFL